MNINKIFNKETYILVFLPLVSLIIGGIISFFVAQYYALQSVNDLKTNFDQYQIENVKVQNIIKQFDDTRRREMIMEKEEDDVVIIYKATVASDMIYSEYEPTVYVKALKQSGYLTSPVDEQKLKQWDQEMLDIYDSILTEVKKRISETSEKDEQEKVMPEQNLYFENYRSKSDQTKNYRQWHLDVNIYHGESWDNGVKDNWKLNELENVLSNQIKIFKNRLKLYDQ